MRTRLALGAALALTALMTLTACSGTQSTGGDAAVGVSGGVTVEGGAPAVGSDAVAPELGAPDAASEARAAAVPGGTGVPVDRQIVKTGYVSMRVADVGKATFEVHGLVKKRNGLISSEDAQSTGDASYANITAQIPADQLDAFIADVSSLGTVDSVNVTAQDVTTQVVDLDARIRALQTSVDRLTQLLAQATRIEDLLTIETQLSQRQAELDALKAQRAYLGDQVALSTITVSLSPITQVAPVDAPGFWTGLQNGWAAFVSIVLVAITALGFLLPFLLILAIIAIPVTIVIVRQARRHRPTSTSDTSTPDHTPTPGA